MGRYWLVLDVTGSLYNGTGLYMMVLGQYSIAQVMVDAWWYWVSRVRYWLVLGIQWY